MTINFLYVVLLAIIQGAAELLPVSSSAHVVVAEKLLGLDPSSPEMTFLLVMLHTGTMGAVLVYFWKRWADRMGRSESADFIKQVLIGTVLTGIVGGGLVKLIEHFAGHEVEDLFGNLWLVGGGLLAAGIVILVSSNFDKDDKENSTRLEQNTSAGIGLVQGLCLPFRGFSRSGATISIGLMQGLPRSLAEDFSFALAVVLTPAAVGREAYRLFKHSAENGLHISSLVAPGLVGAVLSFVAGLVALKLLSSALEGGRWKYFGYYCLVAALVVFGVAATH